MRLFYEAWNSIESNSSVAIDEIGSSQSTIGDNALQEADNDKITIRQLQLTNYVEFPLAEFLSISFTHHIAIINHAKDFNERLFYIRFCHNYKPTTEDLPNIIKKQDLYHHQDKMPNNFLDTIPDYKQAYRAIRMFKDEYLLDFINVEELGMHDEDVDESVIESNIVHNVKNFIMTYLSGQDVMTSNLNNAARMSMDDFFSTNHYKGEIYMTTNMQNKSLQQYCATDSLLKKELAHIEKQISDFEEHIWKTPVDSVEQARLDSIATASLKGKKAKASASEKTSSSAARTSRRGSSASSGKKEKSGGSSGGGGGAPRVSVRRQRH